MKVLAGGKATVIRFKVKVPKSTLPGTYQPVVTG